MSIWTYEKVVLSWSNLWDIPSTDIYFSNLDTVYLSGSNGEFSFETGSFNSENLLSSINIRINVLKSKLTGKEKISLNFTKTPIVKYILEGKEISYFLSENDDWYFNNTDIEFTNIKFRWLETTWKTQAKGKQTVWNNDIMQNFSDLSLSNPRSLIRQNGYKITKWMKNGQVVKWIKYVEWDVYISWDPSLGLEPYETLVVKDWNVIIEDNLNTSWKKLWIIVLKDWYDINKDFKNKWNIYIEPNVTYIHAALYADWWLISANTDGEPFIEDSVERTETLNKQLVIKWFLFTRNTIWWAFAYWWDYILPWWSKTTDFDMALIYDINLLRRNNDWYPSIYNKTKDWNVVTLYDALLQTDCPKWFNY